MNKTASTTIRLDPEMKRRLQELAKADRRSLSSYVELLIARHLEAQTEKAIAK